MATANETVKKVLDNLNQRISSVGGVVDKWSDGNGNWWRKYADGFVEQGGFLAGSEGVNVTFNTSFTSTNYSFLVCPICPVEGESGSYASREVSGRRTTSSTRCYVNTWGGDNGRFGTWFACGY